RWRAARLGRTESVHDDAAAWTHLADLLSRPGAHAWLAVHPMVARLGPRDVLRDLGSLLRLGNVRGRRRETVRAGHMAIRAARVPRPMGAAAHGGYRDSNARLADDRETQSRTRPGRGLRAGMDSTACRLGQPLCRRTSSRPELCTAAWVGRGMDR